MPHPTFVIGIAGLELARMRTIDPVMLWRGCVWGGDEWRGYVQLWIDFWVTFASVRVCLHTTPDHSIPPLSILSGLYRQH